MALVTVSSKRVLRLSLSVLLPATIVVQAMSTRNMNIYQKVSPLSGTDLRDLVLEASRVETEIAEDDMMSAPWSSVDLQGIVWMEHINLVVGNKELAEYFFLDVLGFTRDSGNSFHVNLGQQQFHLAESKGEDQPPQCVAGSIGLAFPNLSALRLRLVQALESGRLADTYFELLFDYHTSASITADDDDPCLTVRGPWGNIFYCYSVVPSSNQRHKALQTPQKMTNLHSDGGSYGPRMAVRGLPGIRFVEIVCPKTKAPAVAKFYQELIGCTVQLVNDDSIAIVSVGPGVHLVFPEIKENLDDNTYAEAAKAMQGIHLCFYVDDFKGLYERLYRRHLIWTNPRFVHLDTCDTFEEAVRSRTLRFKDIVDVDTDSNDDGSSKILELEHETRPLRHGQFMKVPKYEPK